MFPPSTSVRQTDIRGTECKPKQYRRTDIWWTVIRQSVIFPTRTGAFNMVWSLHLCKTSVNDNFLLFLRHFKYTLRIFFIKGTIFCWEFYLVFLAPRGQRLPGAARDWNPHPEIPSLYTCCYDQSVKVIIPDIIIFWNIFPENWHFFQVWHFFCSKCHDPVKSFDSKPLGFILSV